MNQDQINIRIDRHLQAESQLLDELESLCNRFSELTQDFSGSSADPVNFQSTNELLERFSKRASRLKAARQDIMALCNARHQAAENFSIRALIEEVPQPFRQQLEFKRKLLVERMNRIRAQVAGDSALVFYSFDFYRRIVNGLVDCIIEEQNYKSDGTTNTHNSGKLLKRAC